ncbi:hypothetical protein [Streptomyces rubiginosohelvolus]
MINSSGRPAASSAFSPGGFFAFAFVFAFVFAFRAESAARGLA